MDGIRLSVEQVQREADGILRYELRRLGGGPLPRFTAGAHVDVEIPGGFKRSYSLCNDPAEQDRYVIAVQREEKGRGGSRAMHEQVRLGNALVCTEPKNAFALTEADEYVLIAGGIGITPLLAMVHQLQREGRRFTLHYCTRSPERTAFRNVLAAPELQGRVFLHHDGGDPKRGLDVNRLLGTQAAGAHLFCCGPEGLMGAVRSASQGWAPGTVHFESFAATTSEGDVGFEVEIASSGQVIAVAPRQTLLQALRANGLEIPSDCEAGTCGTCVTGVMTGEVEHRDSCLSDAEKRTHVAMCPCVSRARGKRLTLDL